MNAINEDDYLTVDIVKRQEIAQQTVASISVLTSSTLIFLLIYKYNVLVKGKNLTNFVLLIAISDAMYSFMYMFGYPYSTLCSVQGIISLFFERLSWTYTTMLVFECFNYIVYKRSFFSLKAAHALIWSINLLLEVLPLTTYTFYGDHDQGSVKCGYSQGNGSQEALDGWNFVQLLVQIVNIIVTVFFTILIIWYCTRCKLPMNENLLQNVVNDAWKTVVLYPIVELVSWSPSQINNFYIYVYKSKYGISPANSHYVTNITHVISPLYGIILPIVFFWKNEDARLELYNLLFTRDDDYDESPRRTELSKTTENNLESL